MFHQLYLKTWHILFHQLYFKVSKGAKSEHILTAFRTDILSILFGHKHSLRTYTCQLFEHVTTLKVDTLSTIQSHNFFKN